MTVVDIKTTICLLPLNEIQVLITRRGINATAVAVPARRVLCLPPQTTGEYGRTAGFSR